ncbi:MAG: VWA domain-containing protein [Gemmatimonadales bacterium]
MTGSDMVEHVAGFAGRLRDEGIPVGMTEEIDGVAALALIDLLDPREVAIALKSAFRIQPEYRSTFDGLFEAWWLGQPVPRKFVDMRAGAPRETSESRSPAGEVSAAAPETESTPSRTPDTGDPGYSPEALLRRKPFDEYDDQDLKEMRRLLRRLKLRLATRRSRRLVPSSGPGVVDLRRSFRRSLAAGGDLFPLARRAHPIERPRLVLLCDTSGSMDTHTRFLLTFVLSLSRVARRTEVFAFNTALTRLTPLLSRGDVSETLERLERCVPDWSGGTRIGGCLAEFVDRYQRSLVDGRTVVVVLSDGLDRGAPQRLAAAMRFIHRAARSVIWLNPLMGDTRYEPIARGMAAALPFIDHFASAHNLESLERVVPVLAA